MISHHDSWKKGLATLSVGAPEGPAPWQPQDPQKRQSQIQKNQHLVHEANNSLAPVSGHESNLGRRFHVFNDIYRSPSCTYSILEPSGPLAIGSKMLHCPRAMVASWFHFHGSRQPPQLRKPTCNGATSNRMALTFPFLCPSVVLRRTSSCSMRIPATWPKPRKRPKRADSICHCAKACSTFLQSKCQESKSAVQVCNLE